MYFLSLINVSRFGYWRWIINDYVITQKESMNGRVKKKKIAGQSPSYYSALVTEDNICQLCMRPIPKSQLDAHHLIPKSRGGVDTVILHRLCHRQIHALLTESQLARNYSTIAALRSHPEITKFIEWISTKPTHILAAIKRSRDKGFL